METIFLIVAVGILIIASFLFGAETARKLVKNEKIEFKNPIEVIQEKREEKERKEIELLERQIEEINMHNIEIYDGTASGQKSFPEGSK